jgi:hypothetical protein
LAIEKGEERLRLRHVGENHTAELAIKYDFSKQPVQANLKSGQEEEPSSQFDFSQKPLTSYIVEENGRQEAINSEQLG